MYTMATTPEGALAVEVGGRSGVVLSGVTVRPLAWGETAPLQRVFDGLSARSRRLRFLAAAPYLHPAVLRRLAQVDHDRHGAWVVTLAGEPVGVGRYVRTAPDPLVADVAFEVVDACQGHGLGRLLLDVVGIAAADAGVTSLLWLVDEDNHRVRRLAAPLGGRFVQEYGTLEGTTALPTVRSADAARIVHCARSARARAALDSAA